MKIKKVPKNKQQFKLLIVKFLLLILMIATLLTASRLPYFFHVVDNYLILVLGWVRFLIYLFLVTIAAMVIFNQRRLITTHRIFLSFVIFLNLLYFSTNIFQLVNTDTSQFWKRETIVAFKIKINDFINNYQNFIKKINNESEFKMITAPWLNCETGVLGFSIIFLTNSIMNAISLILSYIFLFYLLAYFISSKVPRLFFSMSYSFLKVKKFVLTFFKKNSYIVYKNDKYFLRYFKSQITINYKEVFNNEKFYKKKLKLTSKKNSFQGIYAIYVDNFYGKEKLFLPCYIGKSNNIINRWKSHSDKIKWAYNNPNDLAQTLAVYQRIASYLHAHKLKPEDLKFIVLEWVRDDKKLAKSESYWINKIGTTQRGWNSIRA